MVISRNHNYWHLGSSIKDLSMKNIRIIGSRIERVRFYLAWLLMSQNQRDYWNRATEAFIEKERAMLEKTREYEAFN